MICILFGQPLCHRMPALLCSPPLLAMTVLCLLLCFCSTVFKPCTIPVGASWFAGHRRSLACQSHVIASELRGHVRTRLSITELGKHAFYRSTSHEFDDLASALHDMADGRCRALPLHHQSAKPAQHDQAKRMKS